MSEFLSSLQHSDRLGLSQCHHDQRYSSTGCPEKLLTAQAVAIHSEFFPDSQSVPGTVLLELFSTLLLWLDAVYH